MLVLIAISLCGGMVDTHDLKSCAKSRTGSSPVRGNNGNEIKY